MNLTVLSEVRFCRVADGSVWADASPYEFWTRYLDEFNFVTIVAREERIDAPRPGMQRSDGPGVRLRGVPHYMGSREFMLRWRGVCNAVRPLVYEPDALILRLGSLLALGLQGTLLRSGRPYGVEVVGDPWDTFAPGVSTRRCEAWSGGSSPAVSSGCALRLPARPTSRRSRSNSAIPAREMRGPCPTSSSKSARRSRRTTRASS